jgi:uncharacterized protein YukE
MDHLADRLEQAADAMATLDRRMPALAVASTTFGDDDAGVPGRLGRALHARWQSVIDARAREAGDLAARLAEAARSVRATGRDYETTDDAVRRRLAREL